MNKFAKLTIMGMMAFGAVACGSKKTQEKDAQEAAAVATAVELAAGTYQANVAESSIKWTGTKPTGEHFGTFKLSEGTFAIENNMVVSGDFIIDMNSITVDDIPADNEMNGKLVGHLKHSDFFDVEQFPTAQFSFKKMAVAEGKTELTGALTLKDKTIDVSFPAEITTENGVGKVKAMLSIDRTKWGINYKSKSVFADLADKFINDEVALELNMVASVAEEAAADTATEEAAQN